MGISPVLRPNVPPNIQANPSQPVNATVWLLLLCERLTKSLVAGQGSLQLCQTPETMERFLVA